VLDPPETNQRLEIKTKHSHISHSSQAEYTPTHRAVSTQPFASASGLSLIPALPFPQPLLLELTASPPCSCQAVRVITKTLLVTRNRGRRKTTSSTLLGLPWHPTPGSFEAGCFDLLGVSATHPSAVNHQRSMRTKSMYHRSITAGFFFDRITAGFN
jgi:hypothetical protein